MYSSPSEDTQSDADHPPGATKAQAYTHKTSSGQKQRGSGAADQVLSANKPPRMPVYFRAENF